ncbi:hypothetical protein SODG_001839 [Sodalis praecaptivus]|nr:hypothetical protein NVIRENTERO_02284 [Sodalis praecaptivus]
MRALQASAADRANERCAWQASRRFDPVNDAAFRREWTGFIMQKWVCQHKLSVLLIVVLALELLMYLLTSSWFLWARG